MNNKTKRAIGISLRALLVLIILLTVIFKYNDLVNIDVRALVDKTDSLLEAGAAVVGIYSLKAVVFVIPAVSVPRGFILTTPTGGRFMSGEALKVLKIPQMSNADRFLLTATTADAFINATMMWLTTRVCL